MDVNAFMHSIDFRVLLEYYHFDNISESGNKLRACCKIHGGDSNTAFEVDTTKNLWYCHSGCKSGGTPIKLVQTLEKVDFFTAIIRLSEICKIDISGLTLEKAGITHYEEATRFFEGLHPLSPLQIYTPPPFSFTPIKGYRGICEQTCKDFNLRLAKSYDIINLDGTPKGTKIYNRVVFDVVINNRLVGQSLRAVDKTDTFRWIHMPTGFKRSQVLFNYDYALSSQNNTIIVVEGIMDVLRVYDAGHKNVVGILGCNITKEQLRLLSSFSTSIILMLDNDVAGLIATQTYNSTLKKYFDVYNVIYPNGKKDPGECTVDEINNMVDKVVRVL